MPAAGDEKNWDKSPYRRTKAADEFYPGLHPAEAGSVFLITITTDYCDNISEIKK